MPNLMERLEPAQLGRMLDMSKASEATFVVLFGAAGSGKSTLADTLSAAVGEERIGVAHSDNIEKWEMPRWQEHISEFDSQNACLQHFTSEWVRRVATEYHDKKLVILDTNVDPVILQASMASLGEAQFTCILVQPSQEIRAARLANDASRTKWLTPEQIGAQITNEDFPNYLRDKTRELGLPHIGNEDLQQSIRELAGICARLLRDAEGKA